ncbi:MAG: transglutaminase-like domain-containing protein [Planctomycetota bacterium]|nr:transglutaminase-like domain-containing protein [Planctomycetota bacterium]
MRAALRAEFAAAGRTGRAALLEASKADDARARAHARELLVGIERNEVVQRLVRHVVRPHLDLERALFLLGRLDRHDLDTRAYTRALDAMGAEVRRRAERRATPIERARVLVGYLASELGFEGDAQTYYHPDNVHLHRTIERKRGLPLTLTALYLFVGRRAGLRVDALPMPGHVLLRLHGRSRNLIVDPFHACQTRSQQALKQHLVRRGKGFDPTWFRPASDRDLFARQIRNLANGLRIQGRTREALALSPILGVMAR